MKIPEFSVNRRVTTAMLAMILVVLGFIAFTSLGLDFFPDIDFPTVSVVTTYSGASSEDIENTITRPLEQIINTISRVKEVNSMTIEGASVIMVEFEWGTNLDFAAQDIRDQVGLYRNFIPEEASDPLVVKFNLGEFPIIFGGITADRPTLELKKIIEDEVAPRLERIEGVAAAQVFSMDTREILVAVDKVALESLSISMDQILMALGMENLNLPAGRITERHSEYLLRTVGEFQSLDDIRNTIIGSTQTGQLVYLTDVAEVRDTLKDTRLISRTQGEKGVFYFISKRSGANTVTTAQAVNRELDRIKATLPSDIKFFPFMDQAEMIQRVIRRTGNNALVGGILAIFFIFVFLRDWRPTLTIALAIPLSVITTFIAFYLAGYTINLLTLGGLALGIGMLVDNAVVVIENVFRHMEEGKKREEAAKKGASEVGMAITASTLTTIAVFFPMIFAQGITGRLTRGLALAIAFSLLASLFVALTIVPMVASVLFKANSQQGSGEKSKRRVQFEKVRNSYRRSLHWTLKHRALVLGGILGLLALSFAIVPFLGTEFMPAMDREMIILKVKMPVGTSLEETNRVVTMVEKLMAQEPEVVNVSVQVGSQAEENPADMAGGMSTTGSHEGLLWVGLVPLRERELSDVEVMEKIRRKLPKLKDVKFESLDIGQAMMGGATAPVEIKIFGEEIDTLKEIGDAIVERIRDVEGLRDVTHSLAEGKPEYHITIEREKASRMGLKVSQIGNAIQAATLGKVATRFREGNEEVDIRVRFQEKFRDSLEDIRNIPIMTPFNTMVTLGEVATITRGEGPIRINRENQARVITVTGNIAGRDLGSVVRDIQGRIAGVERGLPAGYFTEFGGQFEQMQEAFVIIAGAFALATLLVYMIMASQFESFRHPFVIMFTIPLAIVGVILALLVSGRPVSLPVLIGFIMLGGIAVNNGIVMVDYINQLKRRGVDKKEAILQASAVRLRPVLITAFTTILGMMPMALSVSEGAEMRAPMAITVVGGLVATTFLTLFVIPIIYSLFDKVKFKEKAA
ncbi:MAG: efflux RND transporter permease subunit [Candidatus Aminicenantes bacterium]|nr:MAG: efflux RND transporter permease subunit [Candidatus Aminicenantes bacterium]